MLSTPSPLLAVTAAQKKGHAVALPSICSAHEQVLVAALEHARRHETPLLVEATSNQVNQQGGYTGMTPADFAARLKELAIRANFPAERILLGGDHLGPNPWRGLPADEAMEHAAVMVGEYVRAGFCKIHLDASMALGSEPHPSPREIALRAARLAAAAEAARAESGLETVYVVGTEVPTPGGAREEHGLQITRPQDARESLALFRAEFEKAGIHAAWERTIALVVQPGVEFGDAQIHAFHARKAAELSNALNEDPRVVFEAHSTDYQAQEALRGLVQAHFGILKVGPWLTWAWREALFALAAIENELAAFHTAWQVSDLENTAIRVMRADPRDWQAYHHGTPDEISFALRYSLSDRIRYYWLREPLRLAVERLFANLSAAELPWTLISQYLPQEADHIAQGRLSAEPLGMARAHVAAVLEKYRLACGLPYPGV